MVNNDEQWLLVINNLLIAINGNTGSATIMVNTV